MGVMSIFLSDQKPETTASPCSGRVLKTAKEKYGSMMESGGNNLKEFLVNLPEFHNRFMMMYT